MTWVAGVDGCSGGWVSILRESSSNDTRCELRLKHISDVLELPQKPAVVAVDVPIGLLEAAERGGRYCDRMARQLLGQPRARSIFSPPIRLALEHSEYPKALAENRRNSADGIGISKQCFCLFDKIRQVDQWIDPKKQKIVREVHPEVCFFEMNRCSPMTHTKKSARGEKERKELLISEGFGEVVEAALTERLRSRSRVGVDDVLDACAACWTADRIRRGIAIALPPDPDTDARGLKMEMLR